GFAGARRAAAKYKIVVADRLDIFFLSGGARANLAASLAQIDRRGTAIGRCTDHLLDDVRDLLRRNVPFASDRRLELLDDFSGLEDRLLVAADVDFAVTSGNLGRHTVANASQVLVACAEQ